MEKLNTNHLSQCIKPLELSMKLLKDAKLDSGDYEVFRNAAIKGFELTLETSGKLLRKALKAFIGTPREIDKLTYKDLFRYASKYGLLESAAVERWFAYRDNQNNTAYDYGLSFAKTTLKLLPDFLKDAKDLQHILNNKLGSSHA